ncbi:MAG: hypothetical protein HY735_10730 [Verrucomicrobia bacterium]|nr:hypothetical protein [Verrucomicrobiota bacterium]
MKSLRRWKIILGLVLVFAAGAVTGSVGTHLAIERAFSRSLKFGTWTADVMQFLQQRLKLSPDQKTKIRPIVDVMGQQLKATFGRTIEESGQLLVRSSRRIDQELTPDQRLLHEKIRREFRSRIKEKLDIDLPEE